MPWNRFGLFAVTSCLLLAGWTFDVHAQTFEAEGQILAQAATASGTRVFDVRSLGVPASEFPGPSYTATATATAQSLYTPGDAGSLQAAEASASLFAQIGGLRGSVTATSSIGDHPNADTGVAGNISTGWSDVVTFRTPNAQGVDYVFSITLDDMLTTVLSPSFVSLSSAQAFASTALLFNGRGLLSVTDSQSGFVSSTLPTYSASHPASRTVSAVMHLVDGETVTLHQILYVSAGVSANGMAAADAFDTAFFNLYSADPTASYTTASGSVFAESGDPFAVAPVPEPSEWALMAAGLAWMGIVGRRRRSRAIR